MRQLSLTIALVLAAGCSASAQLLSVGALGGVRLTDGFTYADESKPYVVGGSVEIRLPAHFAVEANALYQRVGDTVSFYTINGAVSSSFVSRERGNSWQFPLYVKYYFRPDNATWRPFVGTGYAFRTVSFHGDSSVNVPGVNSQNFSFRSNLGVGASVVAGLRFHYGPVAILPQVRYTRWGESSNSLDQNETTLLLGLSF
jgi:hypothetical protein